MSIIIMYKVLLLANTAIDVTEGTRLLSDFAKAYCTIRHTINPHRMLIYMPNIYFSLGVCIRSFVDYCFSYGRPIPGLRPFSMTT